jgi:hypothetical protein
MAGTTLILRKSGQIPTRPFRVELALKKKVTINKNHKHET